VLGRIDSVVEVIIREHIRCQGELGAISALSNQQ